MENLDTLPLVQERTGNELPSETLPQELQLRWIPIYRAEYKGWEASL